MSYERTSVEISTSRLKFAKRDETKWPWWRDLDLDGEQLYRIGSSCDTCDVILGRFTNTKLPIAPPELGQQLRQGLSFIPRPVIDTIATILPEGEYIAALLNFQPKLVELDSQDKAESPRYLWENSQQVSMLINPQYKPSLFKRLRARLTSYELWPGLHYAFYEQLLPLVDKAYLNQETLDSYIQVISSGGKPTALAISLVDVRYPQARGFDWRLLHFLLDGHHKMMAASELDQPITLLSFLNTTESFAPEKWIEKTRKAIYGVFSRG